MLTRWLTFTALLAGSANPERAAITIAPTCRVKGHPETELTLKCGDRKNAGLVQYWHTPFGELQTNGFHSKLDPVFMHHEGSLVVPNTSSVHSGLYYCLLQHTEGITLWPYELHVSHTTLNNQEHSKYEHPSSCDAFRFRREAGSEAERQAGVPDGQFAGAVAASVLLTFVLGFCIGALSRNHVLRCLGAVTMQLRSPRKQQCQTDMPDHGSEVTVTTLMPMYDNQAFEMELAETTISSTASSPPTKPQRSFRNKLYDKQETTAYLEGCNYVDEEKRIEKEVAGRSLKERDKGCDGETEEEEEVEFYLLEDGGGQTETDEDKCSEGEEKDGRESTEETKEWGQEQKVEDKGEQEKRNKDGGEGKRKSEEEVDGNKEKGRDEKMEVEKGWSEKKEDDENKSREDREMDICSETGSKKHDAVKSGIIGETVSSPPRPGRRSRIIRLYQYDDEGQRYCHLPEPTPDEPGPAPRLKHRSVSLTRLNAIMAAASTGPLHTRETGGEKPHFHIEI